MIRRTLPRALTRVGIATSLAAGVGIVGLVGAGEAAATSDAPGLTAKALQPSGSSSSARPWAGGLPVKVLGMKAPSNPDAAVSDDESLAWVIKHGTPSELREVAADLDATYPLTIDYLGATCDKGHAYVAIWAANFVSPAAHLNVTLDGAGYAGATVLATSHDYGAIGVPDGPHTLAFVDPATGAVAMKHTVNLTCGAKDSSAPKTGRKTWSTTGTKGSSRSDAGTTAPLTTHPEKATPRGPKIETDNVAGSATNGSAGHVPTGVGIMPLAGLVAFTVRRWARGLLSVR